MELRFEKINARFIQTDGQQKLRVPASSHTLHPYNCADVKVPEKQPLGCGESKIGCFPPCPGCKGNELFQAQFAGWVAVQDHPGVCMLHWLGGVAEGGNYLFFAARPGIGLILSLIGRFCLTSSALLFLAISPDSRFFFILPLLVSKKKKNSKKKLKSECPICLSLVWPPLGVYSRAS